MNYLALKNPRLFAISTLLKALTYAGLLVSIAYACYEMFYLKNASIHAENHFVENMQVIVCALASVVFFVSAFINGEKAKMIPLFFATLAFAFIFREVDFEKLDVPEIVKTLGSGKGRNIIMIVLFVSVFTGAFLKFKFYLGAVFKFLRTKTFIVGVLSALILVASDILERSTSIPNYEFWEETVEYVGYTFFLLSAITYIPAPIEDLQG